MTEFFHYDELTWPEIAALDHQTQLVLPIGRIGSWENISTRLGNPSRLGVLPAIPYGFPGSIVESTPTTFKTLVANLMDSIRQGGFTNLVLATPDGLEVNCEFKEIHCSATQSKERISDLDLKKVVILPIGHVEQHGHHLPLITDTSCIDGVARGIADQAADRAVVLPVFPYGVSMHRAAFAGTTSVGGRAFEDFWVEIVDHLVSQGFRKMYLLSGHGGNVSFLTNVVKYAGDRHPEIFCATSWLYLSGPKGVAALNEKRESKIGGMGHACELETSLMLLLHPDLVHMDRVIDETEFICTPSYYQDWVEGGALIANPPWEDDTATGAYGAGSLATAEKGEFWLRAAIDEKIDHIGEINEQYQRRSLKKKKDHGNR